MTQSETIEPDFEQLIAVLSTSSDTLNKITYHLQQQTSQLTPSFITQSYQSILILEHWAWKLLSQNSHQWLEERNCFELFQALALFNKNLIFNYDNITADDKVTLLIPDTKDWIQNILEQIQTSNDENELYISIASLWFDNLSYFFHNNPQVDVKSTIHYMGHYMGSHFLMTDQFKYYLTQFQQLQGIESIITAKQLFYLKTCSLFLSSYFTLKAEQFSYTPDQMLEHIGKNYLQIINIHTQNIESWNESILTICTHLIGLINACCWWEEEKKWEMKILFPSEQTSCDHVQALIRIISYKSFYNRIVAQRSNDETILMDSTLLVLIRIAQTHEFNWFFHSMIQLPDTLLTIAESSVFNKICLIAYGILVEILTDEQLRDLKIVDSVAGYFFSMLEQAWHHPSKKCQQIPIPYFLRGFLTLSKNDTIQQKTTDANKVLLFIEMSDQYPMVYDILWALSFNQDIQRQLRSNTAFMTKLAHLPKGCDNEQMRKITHGILWNLESNHEERTVTAETSDEKVFDIMISYSHKDEVICRRIYNELIKAGFRIWIDFDQMHGNVMDAMAQAIEQSKTVLICMSEQYRRSNYCRAEAHYAFQRQLNIVPILLQEHYKPDGWLLFLIGQLLYVNFTKYDFVRAMEMLIKEVQALNIEKSDKIEIQPRRKSNAALPVLPISSPTILPPLELPENILDWTQAHVHGWLTRHKLVQMSRLLSICDGRSLVYLHEFIKNGETHEILSLLKQDSLRLTNANFSLVELSCFQSLMDRQRNRVESTVSSHQINIENNNSTNNSNNDRREETSFAYCQIM